MFSFQLFEPISCTYTYILACASTRKTVIIDPVLETVERDAKVCIVIELSEIFLHRLLMKPMDAFSVFIEFKKQYRMILCCKTIFMKNVARFCGAHITWNVKALCYYGLSFEFNLLETQEMQLFFYQSS